MPRRALTRLARDVRSHIRCSRPRVLEPLERLEDLLEQLEPLERGSRPRGLEDLQCGPRSGGGALLGPLAGRSAVHAQGHGGAVARLRSPDASRSEAPGVCTETARPVSAGERRCCSPRLRPPARGTARSRPAPPGALRSLSCASCRARRLALSAELLTPLHVEGVWGWRTCVRRHRRGPAGPQPGAAEGALPPAEFEGAA